MVEEGVYYTFILPPSILGSTKIFSEFRREGSFLDVMISTHAEPGRIFRGHRVLLAAVSVVLKKKFLSSPDPTQILILKGIDSDQLRRVFDFLYDGRISVKSKDEFEDFCQAVRSLGFRFGPQIDSVVYDASISLNENPILDDSINNRDINNNNINTNSIADESERNLFALKTPNSPGIMDKQNTIMTQEANPNSLKRELVNPSCSSPSPSSPSPSIPLEKKTRLILNRDLKWAKVESKIDQAIFLHDIVSYFKIFDLKQIMYIESELTHYQLLGFVSHIAVAKACRLCEVLKYKLTHIPHLDELSGQFQILSLEGNELKHLGKMTLGQSIRKKALGPNVLRLQLISNNDSIPNFDAKKVKRLLIENDIKFNESTLRKQDDDFLVEMSTNEDINMAMETLHDQRAFNGVIKATRA